MKAFWPLDRAVHSDKLSILPLGGGKMMAEWLASANPDLRILLDKR